MKTNKDFSMRREISKRIEVRHQQAVKERDFFSTKRGSHDLHPLADEFINRHCWNWIMENVDEKDWDEALLLINMLLNAEPDLVRDKSWNEIYRLAMTY